MQEPKNDQAFAPPDNGAYPAGGPVAEGDLAVDPSYWNDWPHDAPPSIEASPPEGQHDRLGEGAAPYVLDQHPTAPPDQFESGPPPPPRMIPDAQVQYADAASPYAEHSMYRHSAPPLPNVLPQPAAGYHAHQAFPPPFAPVVAAPPAPPQPPAQPATPAPVRQSTGPDLGGTMQFMMMNQMMMQQMSAQQMQQAQMAALTQQHRPDREERRCLSRSGGSMVNVQSESPCLLSSWLTAAACQNAGARGRARLRRRRPLAPPVRPVPVIQPAAAIGAKLEDVAMENWQEATIILCIAIVGLIYLVSSRADAGAEKDEKKSR